MDIPRCGRCTTFSLWTRVFVEQNFERTSEPAFALDGLRFLSIGLQYGSFQNGYMTQLTISICERTLKACC